MQNVSAQGANCAANLNMRVDFALDPSSFVAPKDADLIIGVQPRRARPFSQDEIFARHTKSVDFGRRVFNRREDFFLQAFFQRLVRVDLQDPFMAALRRRPVLLLGGVDIFMLDDARAVFAADFQRVVLAEGIDDENLVRPFNGFERGAERIAAVENGEQYGYFRTHGRSPEKG